MMSSWLGAGEGFLVACAGDAGLAESVVDFAGGAACCGRDCFDWCGPLLLESSLLVPGGGGDGDLGAWGGLVVGCEAADLGAGAGEGVDGGDGCVWEPSLCCLECFWLAMACWVSFLIRSEGEAAGGLGVLTGGDGGACGAGVGAWSGLMGSAAMTGAARAAVT